MRAARHGVGRGVGTKLPGWARRRADPQFCQPSARPPRRSLPRLSPKATATPHPLPIRSRPAQPPPTACSRATAPRRSPHRHATEADNDHHGRTEVAGSIQMSKPGSIGVSAEDRDHISWQAADPRVPGQSSVSSREFGAAMADAVRLPDPAAIHPVILPASLVRFAAQADRTIVGIDAPALHPQQMLRWV